MDDLTFVGKRILEIMNRFHRHSFFPQKNLQSLTKVNQAPACAYCKMQDSN